METVVRESSDIEFEVQGGWWTGVHAVLFYLAVVNAALATFDVYRMFTGIASVVLLFYSIFAIFSSPTYVTVNPSARQVTLEVYRYFVPRRRILKRSELRSLKVVESDRTPSGGEEYKKAGRRDLSYSAIIFLELENGRSLRLFRSVLTRTPLENRENAFLVAEGISTALDIPVQYVSGRGKGPSPRR